MSGSKKARSTPSIANNTKIYGIMGGLGPRIDAYMNRWHTGTGSAGGNKRYQSRHRIPLAPVPGLAYMKAHKLLSRNPQSSGGVGKRVLMMRWG